MNARQQMLSDVVIAAVEGGTGYWAQVSNYRWAEDDSFPASAELTDITEQGGQHFRLDAVSVCNAMYRIANDYEFSVRGEIRKLVWYALATNDASNIDADVADVLAQAVAFGKIVYG